MISPLYKLLSITIVNSALDSLSVPMGSMRIRHNDLFICHKQLSYCITMRHVMQAFFKRVIKRKYILNIMILNYCSYKFLIILSLNKRSSILSAASSVFNPLRAFLIISTASCSSLLRSKSSRLVLDFAISIAGKLSFLKAFCQEQVPYYLFP